MVLTLVTTNKHKFEEITDILKPFSIELSWLNRKYDEDNDYAIQEIAKMAAKKLADELKTPIVLEDTGLFLEAYPGFPGPGPKFAINTLGYKGFFKLLQGESPNAYFQTFAAYCEPGKEPLTFEGRMDGYFIDEIRNPNKDMMPYDHFFVPKGYGNKTLSEISMQEKSSISQRGEAFRKLGEYLNIQNTDKNR